MSNVYSKLEQASECIQDLRFQLKEAEQDILILKQQLNAAEEEISSLTACNRMLQDRLLKDEPIG